MPTKPTRKERIRTDEGESLLTMNRRRLLQAGIATSAIAGRGGTGLASARPLDEDWDSLSLREQLRIVRKATQPYKQLRNMARAGYVSSPIPLFCSEGYHFDNLALWETPEVDPRRPEALFYMLRDSGKLTLGGAEYIVVTELDEQGNPLHPKPDLFNDETVSLDGDPLNGLSEADAWHLIVDPASGLVIWDLHVWVHEENPEGVFSLPNPRFADMPGCVPLEL